jgi:hypothetical protein
MQTGSCSLKRPVDRGSYHVVHISRFLPPALHGAGDTGRVMVTL